MVAHVWEPGAQKLEAGEAGEGVKSWLPETFSRKPKWTKQNSWAHRLTSECRQRRCQEHRMNRCDERARGLPEEVGMPPRWRRALFTSKTSAHCGGLL